MARKKPIDPLSKSDSIPSLWLQKVRLLRGSPMVFYHSTDPHRNRPFLPAIINDMAQEVVVKKARQIGATEIGACGQALWLAACVPGTWVIYTLPRDEQASEVSTLRIDAAIEDSQYLTERCVGRNVGRKVFRPSLSQAATLQSNIIMKSSWEQGIGEGTPADALYFDEYDRMKPGVEEAFNETISASKLGLKRYTSTPTLPGRGVGDMYDRSDKRAWMWKCSRCNESQKLDWDINVLQTRGTPDLLQQIRFRPDLQVEPGTFVIVCRKCKRALDRMTCSAEWVTEDRSKSIHGYHLSQLDAPWMSADSIAAKLAKTKWIQLWRNYVLGLEWAGEGQLLSETDVDNAVRSSVIAAPGKRPVEASWVSIGVDWGDVSWLVVVALPQDRRVGKPMILDLHWWSSKGEKAEGAVAPVLGYMQNYEANICIADVGYGQHTNPILRDRLGDRFWGCRYPPSKLATHESKWLIRGKDREIQVGRASSLRHMCEGIKFGEVVIAPMPSEKLNALRSHLTALAPVREEDPTTGDVLEDVVRTGPDHLAHGLNYAMVGIGKGRVSQASLVTSGDGTEAPKDTPELTVSSGGRFPILPPGAGGGGWGIPGLPW